jgi:uncharacterized protein
VEYEWDEAKRRSNLAKHGVDFMAAIQFDWPTAARFPDERRDYGERRWLALGMIDGRLHVLVYSCRGSRIRIISLRKANNKEIARYEKTASTKYTGGGGRNPEGH